MANSLGICQRMAARAAMSDPEHVGSQGSASVSGDDATYYVEEHEGGWRVTYNHAPIGIFKNAGDASRFACDVARMQAQIGRVTWVIVLAEVEEVHRFETRAGSIRNSWERRPLKKMASRDPCPGSSPREQPGPTQSRAGVTSMANRPEGAPDSLRRCSKGWGSSGTRLRKLNASPACRQTSYRPSVMRDRGTSPYPRRSRRRRQRAGWTARRTLPPDL